MDIPEADRHRILVIWWNFFWRFVLFSVIAGAMLGALGGMVVALFGRVDLGSTVGAVLGWLASIPVSYWAIQKALTKAYPGFSVTLQKT